MAELSLSLPVKGEEAPGADAKVNAAFSEIQTQFNGKVATINLEAHSVTDEKLPASRVSVATGNSYAVAKTFTKAEIEAGVEFSASRPAVVLVKALGSSITAPTIGGIALIAALGTGTQTIVVPPAQKLKGTSSEATAGEFNALLL